jgi:hypothetical protein
MLLFKLNLLGMIWLQQDQVGFDMRTMWDNMGGLPILVLLMVPLFVVLTVLPLWMICKKAGFSPAISLLGLIPILGTVLMFYLAFAEWPALNPSNRNG